MPLGLQTLPRTHRQHLSQRNYPHAELFADHHSLEQHRRNIIIDFQQKVQQIREMRDKISAYPSRKTVYLGYKASSHRERREAAENQRVIVASSEGRRIGISNISISCLFPKDEQTGLTPFQKDSMVRMKAKKELMFRKKCSSYRKRGQGQRLQTE